MELDLPPTVHAVLIDDDLVFLDANADIYFCLPLPSGLVRQEGGRLHTADEALVEELVGAGLARRPAGQDVGRRAPPVAPERTARAVLDATPDLDVRFRPAHGLALVAAVRAALSSRREAFRDLIAPSSPSVEVPTPDALLADLVIWRRLAPWLPLDGVCLFRSGMLLAFLRALGHRPDWVFGVRTWPFRAHCWLQVGDLALDDEAERLRAYAPILAA